MVTIKDVAKASGYSISTVSYALNDSKSIPKQTKEKIWAVAKQLNYFPNAAARNLKIKKTYNIGFFIIGFEGPVYHKIYEGVAKIINDSEYNLLISFKQSFRPMITERQIDAAIVMCPFITDEDILLAAGFKIPVFLLDRKNLDSELTYSNILDSYHGAHLATKHLVEKRLKRIAYLSGVSGSYVDEERFRAFNDVCDNAGYDIEKYVYIGDFTENSGYDLARKLKGNIPFEGLCSANDEMAIGFINGCEEFGIKVPENLKVIGFDNIEASKYVAGGISTINVKETLWGEEVAKDILKVLEGKQVKRQKISHVELLLRNSA